MNRRPFKAKEPMKWVLAVWCVLVVAFGATAFITEPRVHNSQHLVGMESTSGYELLEKLPAGSPDKPHSTAVVVWRPQAGLVTDPANWEDAVTGVTALNQVAPTACLYPPTDAPIGNACQPVGAAPATVTDPHQMVAHASGLAPDKRTAFITIAYDTPRGLNAAQHQTIQKAVQAWNDRGVSQVAVQLPPPPFDEAQAAKDTRTALILAITGALLAAAVSMIVFRHFMSATIVGGAALGAATIGAGTVSVLSLIEPAPLHIAALVPAVAAAAGALLAICAIAQRRAERVLGKAGKRGAHTVAVVLLAGGFFFIGTAAPTFLWQASIAIPLAAYLAYLFVGSAANAVWPRKRRHRHAEPIPAVHATHDDPAHSVRRRLGEWIGKHHRWVAPVTFLMIVALALPALFLDPQTAPTTNDRDRAANQLMATGFADTTPAAMVIVTAHRSALDDTKVASLPHTLLAVPGVAGATNTTTRTNSGNMITVTRVVTKHAADSKEVRDTLPLVRSTLRDKYPALASYVDGQAALTADFADIMRRSVSLLTLALLALTYAAVAWFTRSIQVGALVAVASAAATSASLGLAVIVFQWRWLGAWAAEVPLHPVAPPVTAVFTCSAVAGLSAVIMSRRLSTFTIRTSSEHDTATVHFSRGALAAVGGVLVMAASLTPGMLLHTDQLRAAHMLIALSVLIVVSLTAAAAMPAMLEWAWRGRWFRPRRRAKYQSVETLTGGHAIQSSAASLPNRDAADAAVAADDTDEAECQKAAQHRGTAAVPAPKPAVVSTDAAGPTTSPRPDVELRTPLRPTRITPSAGVGDVAANEPATPRTPTPESAQAPEPVPGPEATPGDTAPRVIDVRDGSLDTAPQPNPDDAIDLPPFQP